jgi:hypothetical protein
LVLILAFASLLVPPAYALVAAYGGSYVVATLVALAWLLWLRVAPKLLKPVFENWRDDG